MADTTPAVHQELAHYLQSRPVINPVTQTLKDSSLWTFILGATASSFAILSGQNEQLHILTNLDMNYFRAAQGALAVVNTAIAATLCTAGRYQTYKDLHDFQTGVPAETIIARADQSQKGKLTHAFNWAMDNTHNIVAAVSIPLCGLMAISGITSGRPGEAMSGLLLTFAYAARLRPEQYGAASSAAKKKLGWLGHIFNKAAEHQPGKFIKNIFQQPPLALSAMIMAWRMMPSMINAIYEKDIPLTGMYGMSLLMMTFLANTTKDGIGRSKGSILSEENPNNLEITKVLLEGRLLKKLKKDQAPT